MSPSACSQCLRELSSVQSSLPFCPFCRFPLALLAGKYRFVREMARGGFGVVYLAHHLGLSRHQERVIKVIPKSEMNSLVAERRFWREVEVTAALSQQNEHIVRVYDDFGNDEFLGYYYVMEYLEGETLRAWMSRRKSFSLATALDLFEQMCFALDAAHEALIIHRDLKPDNVLLIERPRRPLFVKMIDFGIAKPLCSERSVEALTEKDARLGTPLYMAPELWRGEEIVPSTDLYALACILYELLCGVAPFQEKSHDITTLFLAHIHLEVSPLSGRLPHLRALHTLDAVMARALAKDVSQRYPSALSFLDAVKAAVTPLVLEEMHDYLPLAVSLNTLPVAEAQALGEESTSGQQDADAMARARAHRGGTVKMPGLVKESKLPTPEERVVSSDELEARRVSVEIPIEESRGLPAWLSFFVLLGVLCFGALCGYWVMSSREVLKPSGPREKRHTGLAPQRSKAPSTLVAAAKKASCQTGETRSCPASLSGRGLKGSCRAGVQRCLQGTWGACDGAILPKTERCNGRDDDCDGLIDEDFPKKAKRCGISRDCRFHKRWRCSGRGDKLVCRTLRRPGVLRLSITPAFVSFWVAGVAMRRQKVRGTVCLGRRQRVSVTIQRSGYSTCHFSLARASRDVRVSMKNDEGLRRLSSYCLSTP